MAITESDDYRIYWAASDMKFKIKSGDVVQIRKGDRLKLRPEFVQVERLCELGKIVFEDELDYQRYGIN